MRHSGGSANWSREETILGQQALEIILGFHKIFRTTKLEAKLVLSLLSQQEQLG